MEEPLTNRRDADIDKRGAVKRRRVHTKPSMLATRPKLGNGNLQELNDEAKATRPPLCFCLALDRSGPSQPAADGASSQFPSPSFVSGTPSREAQRQRNSKQKLQASYVQTKMTLNFETMPNLLQNHAAATLRVLVPSGHRAIPFLLDLFAGELQAGDVLVNYKQVQLLLAFGLVPGSLTDSNLKASKIFKGRVEEGWLDAFLDHVAGIMASFPSADKDRDKWLRTLLFRHLQYVQHPARHRIACGDHAQRVGLD